ncbi:AbiTii domain-containing protein [Candidatus Nitrosotalea okcheonensis]|uniref:AbiTii domain-containing protein n=1 Tax=Candidatus Nitrosotalea okcheonensis TaxID=1903276 RepID=A0A2H1FFX9_9ARCH|nr:hypothetical protein [Candidatus Nitrosotalea okcheonensis]SMH71666.1 conserved protein of unknown function [Candidatus Nitrosotalea okcheonensis]
MNEIPYTHELETDQQVFKFITKKEIMTSKDLIHDISNLYDVIYHPPDMLTFDEKEELIEEKLTSLLISYGGLMGRMKENFPDKYETIKEIYSQITSLSQSRIRQRVVSHDRRMIAIEISRLASQAYEYVKAMEENTASSKSNQALKNAKKLREDLRSESIIMGDLLRECKTICRYLGISENNQWIDWEMNGYQGLFKTKGEAREKLPKYRLASMIFYNPFNRQLQLPHYINEIFGIAELEQPIAELEPLKKNGMMIHSSATLDELNKMLREKGSLNEDSFVSIASVPNNYIDRVINGVKNRIHEFLDEIILELEYGKIPEEIFSQIRREVDHKLTTLCPGAIEKLTITYEQLSLDKNPEIYSQVAATCRRVIKDVADVLYPPTTDVSHSENGKPIQLDDTKFKNRILEAMKLSIDSNTEKIFISSMFSYVDEFLSGIYRYASKGDHAKFNKTDATRCVVYTYLLLGDILHYYTVDKTNLEKIK